jgi:hypothetical protein
MLDGPLPPLLVLGVGCLLLALRKWRGRTDANASAAVVLAIMLTAGVLEYTMGRPPSYQNGPVRLWSGDIRSDQNSQQLFDPYTLTHVVHGAVFYALTRPLLPAASFGVVAAVVATLEAAWEVYENTDQVVNRYRAETISLGYFGDSILNSMADIVACLAGLLLSWRRPALLTLSWVAASEIALALAIRDNLTLNVLMLIYPVPAIKAWQMAL